MAAPLAEYAQPLPLPCRWQELGYVLKYVGVSLLGAAAAGGDLTRLGGGELCSATGRLASEMVTCGPAQVRKTRR